MSELATGHSRRNRSQRRAGRYRINNPAPWPDPTPEMLQTKSFEAIWQCIKGWDINVPTVYGGYMRANGNHVRAILDALNGVK